MTAWASSEAMPTTRRAGRPGWGGAVRPVPQAQLGGGPGRNQVERALRAAAVVAPPDFGQGGQVDLGAGDGAQVEDFQPGAFLQPPEVAPVVFEVTGQGDEPQPAGLRDSPLGGDRLVRGGQEVGGDIQGQQVPRVGRHLGPDQDQRPPAPAVLPVRPRLQAGMVAQDQEVQPGLVGGLRDLPHRPRAVAVGGMDVQRAGVVVEAGQPQRLPAAPGRGGPRRGRGRILDALAQGGEQPFAGQDRKIQPHARPLQHG